VNETCRVEIRVLGPFELVVDGCVVPVRAAGERALLARFAMAPGQIVAADRLIDDLWSDGLPADPRNALQLRVSKLRKLLGGALVTEPHGYRLALGADDVDADRFRRMLRTGQFDEALSLWRGAPYEEFSGQGWADAEAAALIELHATALDERVQQRLDAGESAALVPELVARVAADPFRERPRGQLMHALYRAGRTADALASYHEYRRRLRDELGLTPSATLRQLEEAILRDAPSLAAPPPVAESVVHLPAALAPLIGREAELGSVAELFERSRLVTLVGPGGAGKTSLAIAAARKIATGFRHGVWFVPLAQLRDASHLPAAVAEALGLSDPDARSVSRVVSVWLSNRNALLVVDNCEHLIDECARYVHELLGAAAEVSVLATSREPLGIPGEVQLRIPPLATDDAVLLFSERARAVRANYTIDGAEEDLHEIVARLDRMPLAIELAAARVNTMTVSEIAAGLGDRFALLTSGPRTAEERHRSLRAVVDWSYDLLGDVERTLLRRLAVFRGGWTLDAGAAAVEMARAEVLAPLSALVDRSLVIAEDGRFRMLETIRAYAEARLIESGEHERGRERHALYHTALAERAEPELRGGEQADWLARLRAEDANLRLALDWAREHADDHPDVAFRLAGSLGWYWYVGRQMDGRTQIRMTLAAGGAATDAARARTLQALSLAARPAGCIVHPSNEAAQAARDSLGLFADADPQRAALSRLLLAVEGVAAEDMRPHLIEVERARAALAAHDDAWGAALADFIEMEIRLHHGAVVEALPFGDRAAVSFDELDDDWGRSAVRLHLGHGLRLAGRTDAAEGVLALAVDISRATGLPNNLARSYVELGEAALYRGSADEAEEIFRLAGQVAADVASETLGALALLGLGAVARWRRDPSAAREHFRAALANCLAAEIPRGEARARAGIAATELDEDAVEVAAAELQRALEIARQMGDPSLLAVVREQSARAAAAAGDETERARLLEEADALRAHHGRPRGALEQRDVPAAIRAI
jgi:predicted ATPase/DNA-binding SARP family transcriptional activator/tetratricopeptide (TPR) repeat protein